MTTQECHVTILDGTLTEPYFGVDCRLTMFLSCILSQRLRRCDEYRRTMQSWQR